MHTKIYVKDFGPIQEANIDLDKKFQIYIGPQASGKSTLCRIAYFCKKIRDYYVHYLLNRNAMENAYINVVKGNLKKYLRRNFIGCFGTTKHMQPFIINYEFGKHCLTIKLVNGYVNFSFSKEMEELLNEIIEETRDFYRSDVFKHITLQDALYQNTVLRQQITKRIYDLFEDDSEVIYIPAGRSVLAVMSEQLRNINLTYADMDLTMQEFIERIGETRNDFDAPLTDVVQNYVKTVNGQINNAAVNMAIKMIKQILKADYTSGKDGEKLYYDAEHWVKLLYASSGQQESLWVLLPCFKQILHKQKSFIVIEEPEAHLFPDAQRTMVELIALLSRSTGSTVMITTHSPYILTSVNLLVYSGYVEKQNNKDKTVIPPALRIDPANFTGYSIEEGKMQNIYDREACMMDAEYIDKISSVINQDLDRLLEIQYK